MIAANSPGKAAAKLMAVGATGTIQHLRRTDLADLFQPGDLVVANDAATLPASLSGTHRPTGKPIEIRLAAWRKPGDPTQFTAIVFGEGDHRTDTEERPAPPPLMGGDMLTLGPLTAVVEERLDHPRLIQLRFEGDRFAILAGLARHGKPIQYAHVPEPLALWDVWTNLAAEPVAFEPPSAGFALDWQTLAAWRQRGVLTATLTHAAGISSTGDSALDQRLPFDEPFTIPERTSLAVSFVKAKGGRIIAIGTTVVRALEAASDEHGVVRPGSGIATNRLGPETQLHAVDAILTGMHQPGESHFELLLAFATRPTLDRVITAASGCGYRTHEFGDAMVIEHRA